MDSPETRAGRALLLAWAIAIFAISAVTDLRVLAGLCVLAPVIFWRQAFKAARRVLFSVVPLTVGLSLASWAWLRFVDGTAPRIEPFVSLALRTVVIAFLTFAVLARIDLFRALAPFPTLTRLLVVTLAQIHALRLLATDSLLGLRSRMPRKPGAVDMVRGAGGITGALFTLSTRNARDVSDAMRSRGF